MNDEQEFLILRFSLVEETQRAISTDPIPSPKGAAILAAIDQDREFILNGVKYSFVGFSVIQPSEDFPFPSSRFLVGKTAKLKKTHMGKKVPGDIVETQEDDWLPVLTIFDLVGQYIFIKKDWRFGSPEQTISAIQGGLRAPVAAQYNHTVFVEGVSRKEHFWNIVSGHQKFYKLELKLISPNILETNLCARDALAAMKEMFSQDEVGITLTNESGGLKVPEKPVNDYLEYIEEGEGTWSMTTEGIRGGKKRHSSNQNIDTVELSVPEENVVEDERQLNLATGQPLLNRQLSNERMVAEAYAAISRPREH